MSPNTEILTAAVPLEMADQIRRQARDADRSISAEIRRTLRNALTTSNAPGAESEGVENLTDGEDRHEPAYRV